MKIVFSIVDLQRKYVWVIERPPSSSEFHAGSESVFEIGRTYFLLVIDDDES
jgi:hypothetical protein